MCIRDSISRVVMVDATTGETQDLAIEDVPQWVDHAYPTDLLLEQYNWSGKYKDGWLNSVLGQRNVVQTTPGTDGNLGYNYIAKDDDVWVYTGVTSATADKDVYKRQTSRPWWAARTTSGLLRS